MSNNPKLRLTYFDMPGGRGQPARLAMEIGGIEFEDVRVPFSEWPKSREKAPFHTAPFLEVGDSVIGQSNSISRYVGRLAGLYPEDPWQAALCDEILDAVEECWMRLGPTMWIKDPEELKRARTALAEVYTRFLQQFALRLKRAGGEFFADGRLTVADLQMITFTSALGSGNFEHIPKDLVQQVAPELAEHLQRVMSMPKIAAHYGKFAAHA